MNLLISTQSTVEFDGNFYYGNSVRAMWNRYHSLGDQCRLICHKKIVESRSQDMLDDDFNLVFIKKVNTLSALLLDYAKDNDRIAAEQVKWADMCIVHVPNGNGYQVIHNCIKYNKPYMTVVCGCPWDALWNHGWQGKLMAPKGYFDLKKIQCNSPYSIYVTNEFLQRRYPTKGLSIGCSNVNIRTGEEGVLEKRIKQICKRNEDKIIYKIGTAAALDVAYKGQDYVIKAISRLKKKGVIFEYHLIGRGDDSRLRNMARQYGVSDCVFFHGALPHEDVLLFMDNIDIYIQPSKQEGLPRSLIEAMSRGCFCLGARTAGIPELIEKKFVFRKGSSAEIVDVLERISVDDLKSQAYRNFNKAKEYDSVILNERRNHFLENFVNIAKNKLQRI